MFDGATTSVHSNLAIGRVCGDHREIMAVVSPTATDDDVWRVVNLKSKGSDTDQFDSIAVLGAIDDDQAVEWAFNQRGRFLLDSIVLSVGETNTPGLKRYLDSERLNYRANSQIHLNQLSKLQDMTTGQPVMWDGINLKSHSSSTAVLLVDLVKHDDNSQLFDAIKADDMPALLGLLGAEAMGYDALIVESRKLDTLMQRLGTAMSKATQSGVTVTNVRQSEPFKRNKVTQVAAIFEMSDGQSVSIVFHNPDSTPSKLLPQDTLISWKFLLNSRDISAAVQPNQGEDVQLPVLATRVMKLVNQNSARFARTNAKKAENVAALDEAKARIETKSQTVAALDVEIAQLQAELDKPVPVDPEPAPQQSKSYRYRVNKFALGGGKFSIGAATVFPRVGETFDEQTLSSMESELNADKRIGRVERYKSGLKVTSDNPSQYAHSLVAEILEQEIGEAALKKTVDSMKAEQQKESDRQQLADYSDANSIATSWIDSIGLDLNVANKANLIRFVVGESERYEGIVNWTWTDPLKKINAVSDDLKEIYWDKVRQSYQDFAKSERPEAIAPTTPEPEIKPKNSSTAIPVKDAKERLIKDFFGAKEVLLVASNADNGDYLGYATSTASAKAQDTANQQLLAKFGDIRSKDTQFFYKNNISDNGVASEILEMLGVAVDYADPEGFVPDDLKVGDLYALVRSHGGKTWKSYYEVREISGLLSGRNEPIVNLLHVDKHTSQSYSLTDFQQAVASGVLVKETSRTLDQLQKKEVFIASYGLRNKEQFVVTRITDPDGGDSFEVKSTDGSGSSSYKTLEAAGLKIAEEKLSSPALKLMRGEDVMPQKAPVVPPTSTANPDAEYLQSIVDGTADLSIAGDELERIGDNLPPELEALFEEAAEAYAQYAIGLEV